MPFDNGTITLLCFPIERLVSKKTVLLHEWGGEILKFGLKQGDQSQILFPRVSNNISRNDIPMKTGRKNKKKAGLNVDFVQQKLALVNDTSSRERKN